MSSRTPSRSVDSGLKPMNCPAHVQLFNDAALLLPRPAGPLAEPGPCIATSRAARCTACCASATSRRTTRTSSAPRSRSRRSSQRCLDFGSTIYDTFGFRAAPGALDAPGEARRHRGDLGPRRGRAREGARRQRASTYDARRGRGAFYGAEDRLAHDRLHRPRVAARHRAARLQPARALRAELHRRRQRRAPAGDDPPRPVRLASSASWASSSSTSPASSRSGSRPCRRPCSRSPTATSTTPREVAAALHGGRPARRGRRPHRVGRPQDPRGRAAQDPVHARGRRPRGRAARRRAAPPPRGRPGHRSTRRRALVGEAAERH